MKLFKNTPAVYFVLIYSLCIGTRYLFDKINVQDEKGLVLIIIISIMLGILYFFISNKLFLFVFNKNKLSKPTLIQTIILNLVLIGIVFTLSLAYCHIQYGLKPLNNKLILYIPQTIVLAYAEEIVFRKYLFTILLNYTKKWTSLILSALFFALVHFPYGLQRIIITFSLGLLFGYFYTKTKNIAGTSTAHSLWNMMIQNSYGVF